jgi:hypothetical protein
MFVCLGLFKVAQYVFETLPMMREAFRGWWARTDGIRAQVLWLHLTTAWATWMHPLRCPIYIGINLLLSFGLSACFMFYENMFMLCNYFIGFAVLAWLPRRYGRVYLYLVPALFLVLAYLKTTGQLPPAPICTWMNMLDGSPIRYCILDGSGIDSAGSDSAATRADDTSSEQQRSRPTNTYAATDRSRDFFARQRKNFQENSPEVAKWLRKNVGAGSGVFRCAQLRADHGQKAAVVAAGVVTRWRLKQGWLAAARSAATTGAGRPLMASQHVHLGQTAHTSAQLDNQMGRLAAQQSSLKTQLSDAKLQHHERPTLRSKAAVEKLEADIDKLTAYRYEAAEQQQSQSERLRAEKALLSPVGNYLHSEGAGAPLTSEAVKAQQAEMTQKMAKALQTGGLVIIAGGLLLAATGTAAIPETPAADDAATKAAPSSGSSPAAGRAS